MSRLVTLYLAPNAYIAEALRGALAEARIGCIVRSNEIPMEPGFTFGALYSYAGVLIDEEDLPKAREVMEDLQGAICGESHDCETVYPPRINLHGYPLLGPVVLAGWCASLVLITILSLRGTSWMPFPYNMQLRYAAESGTPLFGLLLAYCISLGLTIALVALNWPLVERTTQAVVPALLMLVVLPFWLVFTLARWMFSLLLRLPKLLAVRR